MFIIIGAVVMLSLIQTLMQMLIKLTVEITASLYMRKDYYPDSGGTATLCHVSQNFSVTSHRKTMVNCDFHTQLKR